MKDGNVDVCCCEEEIDRKIMLCEYVTSNNRKCDRKWNESRGSSIACHREKVE